MHGMVYYFIRIYNIMIHFDIIVQHIIDYNKVYVI